MFRLMNVVVLVAAFVELCRAAVDVEPHWWSVLIRISIGYSAFVCIRAVWRDRP